MSGIKFLKISRYYPGVLERLYHTHPDLITQSYSKQNASVMDQLFATSNFFKTNLEAHKGFYVTEIVVNAEHMQKAWAVEQKVAFGKATWYKDVLKAQILSIQPDIVFVNDHSIINHEFHAEIKAGLPKTKWIIWDGIGVNDIKKFSFYDVVFTCLNSSKDYYLSKNKESLLFPFGFESTIISKLENTQVKYDCSFVGSIQLIYNGHFERLKLLSDVSDRVKLDLFLSGQVEKYMPYHWFQRKLLFQGKLKTVHQIYKVGSRNHGQVYGLDMYRTLAASKITLNIHINRAEEEAANIRLFESTGVGTCLLTDWKKNISNYFKPDEEIVTFKSSDECIEKINYLLNNEPVRAEIARKGQLRTLNEHSFSNRINSIMSYLIKLHNN